MVALLVCAFSISMAFGEDEEEWIAEMRTEFSFTAWPGKNGALKKGLAFSMADYPSLSGWAIAKDEFSMDWLQYGLVRTLILKRVLSAPNESPLILTIAVAHTSIDNAHELLLRLGLPSVTSSHPFKRADPDGLLIGDLCIIYNGYAAASPGPYLAFARNNVVCTLHLNQPANTPALIDLKTLAEQLDARIKALPDLTLAQFNQTRPVITTFAPAAPSISHPHGSTTLNIVASDPSNESLRSVLTNDQGIRLDTEATPPIVDTGYAQAGDYTVKLIMANQSLLFSTAETKITVTIPDQ